MATNKGQLSKKIQITGKIKALTGLHIGGTNLGVAIGGADATVVRNPYNNQPYIPGSSLKGKMRTLTERIMGKFSEGITKFGPYIGDPNHFICELFGITPDDIEKSYKNKGEKFNAEIHAKPTSRLIVRDCNLTKESATFLDNLKTTDMPFTEVKTEVVIDRITSAATPRQMERVPAGAEFELRLILNIYEGDDADNYLKNIFMALALVQNDYIGGKGTRGSGEVAFIIKKEDVKYKERSDYEMGGNWKTYTGNFTIPSEMQSE